jgi:carboxypeptidase Taq
MIKDFDVFFEKLIALEHAVNMFTWDLETGGTPPGAMEARSKTIAVLSAERFAMSISDEMRSFFTAVETAKKHNEAGNITLGIYRFAKKEYRRLICIPQDEYKAFSKLTTISYTKWEEAKNKNDYRIFSSYLQQVIDYQRKFIEYRKQAGMVFDNPYDILLDDYEPGMTVKKLDIFFFYLRGEVVPILQKIILTNNNRPDLLDRNIPLAIQRNVSDLLMNTVGYDLNRGALRETEHPMTLGFGQNDVRITTNYDEGNFFSSFYSVIHECGHAVYEQNIDKNLEGTILDTGTSMGIHESQSRFYENMVGRSLEFWEGIYSEFIRVTEGHCNDISAAQFYNAVNFVKPSLIRTDADELTYSLHIMVRYEIEKMIFNDLKLRAEDLPGLWNEKMQEYLGIIPQSDAEGIMQDVHWSLGLFGYFPSYAIGNIYAAQIWNVMEKDINLNNAIRTLDFKSINSWLAEKIHKHGALLEPREILTQITDEEFSSRYFIDYLKLKYAKIYGL